MSKKKELVSTLSFTTRQLGYTDPYRLTHDLALALENENELKLHSVFENENSTKQILRLQVALRNAKTFQDANIDILTDYPAPSSLILHCSDERSPEIFEKLIQQFHTFQNGIYDLVLRLRQAFSVLLLPLTSKAPQQTNKSRNEKFKQLLAKAAQSPLSEAEGPATKRQRVDPQTAVTLPTDILSKIFSFTPTSVWKSLALVDKAFNHVLFHGSENIIYPVFYIFHNSSKLLTPKFHETLCSILDQIAKLKLDTFTIAKWKTNLKPWVMTPLLMTAARYPQVFQNHQAGIENVMNVANWSCEAAASCTALPRIYERGAVASNCFSLEAIGYDNYQLYQNRNAEKGGARLDLFCKNNRHKSARKGERDFWPDMTVFHHYYCKDQFHEPSASAIRHVAQLPCSKHVQPTEMVDAAMDLFSACCVKTIAVGSRIHSTLDSIIELMDGVFHNASPALITSLHKRLLRLHLYAQGNTNMLDNLPPSITANEMTVIQLVEYKPTIIKFMGTGKNRQTAELAILGEVKSINADRSSNIDYAKFMAKGEPALLEFFPELGDDKEFVIQALKVSKECFKHISSALRNDMELLKPALLSDPTLAEELKEEQIALLVADQNFALEYLEKVIAFIPTAPKRGTPWKNLIPKIAEKHWQQIDIFYSLLMLLPPRFIQADYLVYHASIVESPEAFYKKVALYSPYFMLKCPFKLEFSEEEMRSMVDRAFVHYRNLRFLPPTIFWKFKELMLQRIQSTPSIFKVFPLYAKADLDICIAALSLKPSLLQYVSQSLLSDSFMVLTLMKRVPSITRHPLGNLPFVTKFLFSVVRRQQFKIDETELEENDFRDFFELPLILRRSVATLKSLSDNEYTFTCNAIKKVKTNAIVAVHTDDDERQMELNKLLHSLGCVSSIVWNTEAKQIKKKSKSSSSSSSDSSSDSESSSESE